jgi:hypothetical protein
VSTQKNGSAETMLFGFGFLIIVMTWLGYSRTMAVLPTETPYALLANLVLLFIVAIEPYLFCVLTSVNNDNGLADAASVVYALDVGGMFLMQAALARMVVNGEKTRLHGKLPLHPVVLARFRRVVRLDVVIGLVFDDVDGDGFAVLGWLADEDYRPYREREAEDEVGEGLDPHLDSRRWISRGFLPVRRFQVRLSVGGLHVTI